jgi:hypothetical protein
MLLCAPVVPALPALPQAGICLGECMIGKLYQHYPSVRYQYDCRFACVTK